MIVMCLAVFISLITHLNSVKISRFTGTVFVSLLGLSTISNRLFASKDLFVLADALGQFLFIQGLARLREMIVG
jgi:predicted transporter